MATNYWNHGEALQPCKCPMCSQKITWLIPEAASLDHCQDVEVLERVRKYNHLFVGGTYGLILVASYYLLIKRIIREMMDPEAAKNQLLKARLFAVKYLLGALYTVSSVDFFPASESKI
ncbi:hypothetical protein HYC85_024060 [Camellia sinensis]|uniref:Uncharacterized protein n=1 Tax=Camellia sinensis TaxID=4442 RepID=A0A7J7GAY4_CAMSI|nr:hypothetical protein HYC85_024060 [Camellia sinensis]